MIIKTITNYTQQHDLITPGSTVILGLSGGPDSTFLLHVLAAMRTKIPCTLVAAHLNHGWRTDAEKDVAFCAAMAEQLQVPFIAGHASQFAHLVKEQGSQEDRGRQMRRLFFEHCAQKYPSVQHIALAHHSDDQIETFFIRLARGAGLEGLCGMQPRDGLYIRPLLCISKQEILNYLQEHQISFLIDPTNEQAVNLRSRIRTMLIPALTQTDARFIPSINKAIAHLQEVDSFLAHLAQQTFADISHSTDTQQEVDLHALRKLPTPLRTRVLLHWLLLEKVPFVPSAGFFAEIEKFLLQPAGGTHQLYGQWTLHKKASHAFITKNK